jgi:hypothetical protein
MPIPKMEATMRAKLFGFAIAVACTVAVGLAAKAQQPSCDALSSWFPHSQTLNPDAFPLPFNSNCAFHQWSWNAFLWLTQNVDGAPRFQGFSANGIGTKRGVLDPLIGRSAKARAIELIQQAGPDGVMVDRQGHPIYYSMHSNPAFGGFIRKNDLLDPAKLRAFDPKTPFPKGTLTLKAAWKVVAKGDDVSTYYVRSARIARLTVKNGKIVVDPSRTRIARAALVGFHIAGAVEGHPEMIWATFEHRQNAPDLPKAADTMDPNDKVSDKNWTFYKANTPFKSCNVNSAGAGALTLDRGEQTLSPVTQVCRIVAYGSTRDESGISNKNNITNLNDSVHAQLKGVWNNYFEVGAVWFLAENYLPPDCTFQPGALECPVSAGKALMTGSTELSNSTIETFTQSQSAQQNCFACHNTVQVSSENSEAPSLPGIDVNLSHVLINDYFKAASKPGNQH